LGQNCKTERTERRNLEIPSVIGCISPYICPHTWNKKAGSSQYLYALVFLLQKTFIILPVLKNKNIKSKKKRTKDRIL
jgi:hypothetical protein